MAITITVAGTAGEGKSSIAHLIKTTLLAHGVEVEVVSEDTASEIDVGKRVNSVLAKLVDTNSKVVIDMKQTRR
jgi:thymidylate kinase